MWSCAELWRGCAGAQRGLCASEQTRQPGSLAENNTINTGFICWQFKGRSVGQNWALEYKFDGHKLCQIMYLLYISNDFNVFSIGLIHLCHIYFTIMMQDITLLFNFFTSIYSMMSIQTVNRNYLPNLLPVKVLVFKRRLVKPDCIKLEKKVAQKVVSMMSKWVGFHFWLHF